MRNREERKEKGEKKLTHVIKVDLKRYRISNIVGGVEGMYDGRRKIAQTMDR